ncbi:MAG: hypothetical protein M3R27_10885 [Bacteroidota bacterium]|nr:hypothetical protein [Bacteroidota bacterium]
MKKDILSIVFFVCCVSFFIPSCTDPDKYKSQIRQVDSLSAITDRTLNKLMAIDSVELFNGIQSLNADLEFISEKKYDTLSREQALSLGSCSQALIALKKIQQKIPSLKSSLSISQKKLQELRTDLKANAIADEKVNGYVETESKIIQGNFNSTSVILKIYSEHLSICENNQEIIRSMVNSISEKIQ